MCKCVCKLSASTCFCANIKDPNIFSFSLSIHPFVVHLYYFQQLIYWRGSWMIFITLQKRYTTPKPSFLQNIYTSKYMHIQHKRKTTFKCRSIDNYANLYINISRMLLYRRKSWKSYRMLLYMLFLALLLHTGDSLMTWKVKKFYFCCYT